MSLDASTRERGRTRTELCLHPRVIRRERDRALDLEKAASAARTPRIAGPGMTPRRSAGIGAASRAGSATPRRVGGI